jgi:hypothetical protein
MIVDVLQWELRTSVHGVKSGPSVLAPSENTVAFESVTYLGFPLRGSKTLDVEGWLLRALLL